MDESVLEGLVAPAVSRLAVKALEKADPVSGSDGQTKAPRKPDCQRIVNQRMVKALLGMIFPTPAGSKSDEMTEILVRRYLPHRHTTTLYYTPIVQEKREKRQVNRIYKEDQARLGIKYPLSTVPSWILDNKVWKIITARAIPLERSGVGVAHVSRIRSLAK